MESSRDDLLIATLSALRPAPSPAFAARLDERAAAGFPRRGDSPLARVVARLREMPPRRVLLPACGVALAAIAIATTVVATNEPGTDSSQVAIATFDRQGPAGGRNESFTPPPQVKPERSGGGEIPEYETEVPTAVESSAAESSSPPKNFDGAGRAAQGSRLVGTPNRDVERAAEMVLGTDPTEVGDAASKVFDAVHANNGIVLKSSISNGSKGQAGAEFDLLIPSAKLSDALAAFSGIAEVRSRHEASVDITAPTVGVSERLQDSNAKIESLLGQLAAAESDGEREAVEAELATERRHAASLRSQLSALQRRASFSRVSLRIVTGDGGATPSSGGSWGVGDALGEAGHILAVAAAVTIVGLAILAPFALLALLIWFANRARIHRGRERALG